MNSSSKLFASFDGKDDRGGIPTKDHIAIMAMQGFISAGMNAPKAIASNAYDMAEAMIEEAEARRKSEREAKKPPGQGGQTPIDIMRRSTRRGI